MGNILHGDCQIHMKNVKDNSVDAIITDPPYGMGKGKWDVWNDDLAKWLVDEALRVLKPGGSFYMFGKNETIASMWNIFKPLTPRWLTWHYRNASNINHNTWGWNSQVIVYGYKPGLVTFNLDEARIPYSGNTNTKRVNHDDSTSRFGIKKNGKSSKKYHDKGRKPLDVIEVPAVTAGIAKKEGRWHPTQKPLDLMNMLVKVSTNEGEFVLDPFAGGGTTLVAALNNNRKCLGFEKNDEYYNNILKRLKVDKQ